MAGRACGLVCLEISSEASETSGFVGCLANIDFCAHCGECLSHSDEKIRVSRGRNYRELAKQKNARLWARRASNGNTNVLSGLFQVSRERDNFPSLFCRYPLHFRLEPCGNVKLNHLCHNQPPIHSRLPVLLPTSPRRVLCSVTRLDASRLAKCQELSQG